ncbi:4-demethylwyosine synthase TYW1 [Halodesulfurarchaeum formicicum]|uniref:S-adenosyl-L-methionine-dependent tRNA 4-demethylwyosine synthase n=1 Tax=Halodesulfurarchaeum formicicum TaxID=1873524 RepID=A0A1J1AFD1_9EURY|nr:4-demethylwyosine synthase TYW1 [Halodesulfurarchaeum formicicum]APE96297.1 tRNA-modifying enzyme [Halodesulfurarchaeum formicicum]
MTQQVSGPNYHTVDHTAVQTCGWTKNALRGEGTCYKQRFYGIRSHRCVQMTPVVRCNERCVFCWRDHAGHTYELDGVDWQSPEAVVEASIDLQRELLSGFGGNDDVPDERLEEALDPQHVAISLDGEPTLYPHLPELIEAYHDRGFTTFLVSNGTRPTVLEAAEPTQLYVSVDAPDRETYESVVRPREEAAWDALDESLDVLAAHDSRTTIRTTLVAGENMHDPAAYADLYRRAAPDFIEIKGYMHVGTSRDRLDRSAMPDHEEVVDFARSVQDHLPAYDVFREAPPSNVAMLSTDPETVVPELAE